MKSKKELKKQLLMRLEERLTVFGFKLKASRQAFYRGVEDVEESVHLEFINHPDDFDITMDVSIRLNKVEDLVNASKAHLTDKQKKETATFGIELGNLSRGNRIRWTIVTEKDISAVIDSMMVIYETYGEPYFKQYRNLEAAYELLSSDDRKKALNCPFDGKRASNVIAMAKLLGHSNLQEQIAERQKFLEKREEFDLKEYLEFVKSLSY